MTREFKPGDVVFHNSHGRGIIQQARTGLWVEFEDNESGCQEVAEIGADLRHLVVIDPADRVQVERLRDLMDAAYFDQNDGALDFPALYTAARGNALQAALREFANPTPKPEEPQGLGAVVEDSDGNLWFRVADDRSGAPWYRRNSPGVARNAPYVDIDAARVLSEGIPS